MCYRRRVFCSLKNLSCSFCPVLVLSLFFCSRLYISSIKWNTNKYIIKSSHTLFHGTHLMPHQTRFFFLLLIFGVGLGWFCLGDILCSSIIIIISMDFRDSILCAHVIFDQWRYDEIGMTYEYDIEFGISYFAHTIVWLLMFVLVLPWCVKCIEQITAPSSKHSTASLSIPPPPKSFCAKWERKKEQDS